MAGAAVRPVTLTQIYLIGEMMECSKFFNIDHVKSNTCAIPSRASFKDLRGLTFGKITAVCWAGIDPSTRINQWWCSCNCTPDRYFIVNSSSLQRGLTKSCGCSYKNNGNHNLRPPKDITNAYFLLEYSGLRKPVKVQCKVCGVEIEVDQAYKLIHSNGCSCQNEPLTVYFIGDGEKYKIGITSDVQARMRSFKSFQVIKTWLLPYRKAREVEAATIKEFSMHSLYTEPQSLCGWSEMFRFSEDQASACLDFIESHILTA